MSGINFVFFMIKTLISILAVLLACLFWGLIFVIPLFAAQYSPIEIALGRYLCYGLLSLFVLLLTRPKLLVSLSTDVWLQASYFALIMNFGYYISVILGLRYASPSIIALIIGVSPITIAIYGGWRQGDLQLKTLIWPSILIFSGLICVNLQPILLETSNLILSHYLFGLFCGFFALAAWTWYVIANVQFLQKHPQLEASNWTTIVGVSTLGWSVVGIFIKWVLSSPEEIEKFTLINSNLQNYLMAIAILGILCSWIGFYLWNVASASLPISFAGQLTIFETIFGLIFVYWLEYRLPTLLEMSGIVLMLGGITSGVYLFMKNQKEIPAHS